MTDSSSKFILNDVFLELVEKENMDTGSNNFVTYLIALSSLGN